MLTALRCGRLAAVVEIGGEDLELEIEDGLEQDDLDLAAEVGDAAANQSGENALHEMRSGHHVGDGEAEGNGRLARVAVEIGQAGERLHEQVLAGLVAPWAGACRSR